MLRLEPWNPFDTSGKICFPNVYDALSPNCTLEAVNPADVVDIDHLARSSPVDIDGDHLPNLGNLPLELTSLLEAKFQAWFDEQQRLKAARGDSPTPSCSFKLPGIPFRDTVQEQPADTDTQAAVTGSHAANQPENALRDTPAATTATAVKYVGNEASQPIQQFGLQDAASRQSFEFHSPSRQMAASPTYPFTAPGQGISAAVQHKLPTRDASATESGTTEPSPVVAGVVATTDGSAETRLSWIMQQNMQQLQLILQDQPQQRSGPPGQPPQQHTAQNEPSWIPGPQQYQQQQQDQVITLQHRLSMLLQQNQQQLQQLLEQHTQQLHQQPQLHHELGQQEQQQQHHHHHQSLSGKLLAQAHQLQTQQGLLQLQLPGAQQQQQKTEQPSPSASLNLSGSPSPSVALNSSKFLPGSPERAAAAAAAAVAAANRARQRLPDPTAGSATRSPPGSPERAAAASVAAASRARHPLADSTADSATGSSSGSPARAAAAAAAAVAAANRARQRAADVAAATAAALPPRRVPVVTPAGSPGSPAAVAAVRQSSPLSSAALAAAADLRSTAAAPTAARSLRKVFSVAAEQQLPSRPAAGGSSSCAADVFRGVHEGHIAQGGSTSPAAAAKLSWSTALLARVSSTKASRPQGLLSSQIAAEHAEATVPRLPFAPPSTAVAAAPPRLSWQSLQAIQQQRWQQRPRIIGASAAAIVAATANATRSPGRNMGTQTESPPKDEAVQTDSPPPAAAAAGTLTSSGIPAVTETLAASGLGVRASPTAAGAILQAVSPNVVTAAVAAAAAAAVSSAVVAALSPAAVVAHSAAPTGSQSPVCVATVSAAVAAAVAATTAATTLTSPVYQWQLQPQQQAMPSTPAAAVGVTLPAATTSHVVRSLFAPSHPTTPAASNIAAMRAANISSSVRLSTAAGPLKQVTAAPARTRVRPRVGSAGTRISPAYQEQLHSGPSTWMHEQLQQQRPLPWPELPGVEKRFLSPMKAYQDSSRLVSSSNRRRRRVVHQSGEDPSQTHQLEAVTAAAAGSSSERVPLGDTTNSQGAASSVSSQYGSPTYQPTAHVEASRLSSSARQLADLVASRAAGGDSGGVAASSCVAGVVTGLSDSAIMQAFMPAAVVARPATTAARASAQIVSHGSPALQRLWSEYKAASKSVPSSPAVWYKHQLLPATAELARSSRTVMQPDSPTATAMRGAVATVDRAVLQQGRQADTSPAQSAELAVAAAATDSAVANTSTSRIYAPVDVCSPADQAGPKEQKQGRQSATRAMGTMPNRQPSSQHTTAHLTPSASPVAAAAMLTAAGPAVIPSRFYPPSARKLLGESIAQLLSSHSLEVPRASTLTAATGGSAGVGVAEVAQQQLRLLLEQQLASMALARRPLVAPVAPATAAVVARQPGAVNQGLFCSRAVADGAAVYAAAAAAGNTDRHGNQGDVSTDSSNYCESPTASPDARKILHNKEQHSSYSSSTSGSVERQHGHQQGGAAEAVEQLDVQHGRAGAGSAVGIGVGGSSSNRIVRLVAAYQQQQAGRLHPLPQPGTVTISAQLTNEPDGGQVAGDLIHQATAASTGARLSVKESSIEGLGASAHTHALPGGSASLPEMLQRYLQD